MIKNLVWDADGTLLDTYPSITEALRLALLEFGVEAPAEQIRPLVSISFSHGTRALADEYHLDLTALRERFYHLHHTLPLESQAPFPGVVPLCDYAQALGGKNCIITHRDRASLRRLLETHGLSQTFEAIITGDDGFPRKPHPAAFEALIERQQLDPDLTLAIGDRELDVLAAREAGLHTCFFGTNPHEVQADVEVTDYADLHVWLLRRNLPASAGPTAAFWQLLDALVAHSQITVDRPAGSSHPRHPDFVYPLDYGYLARTRAADGDGVDVWLGSLPERRVTAVVCTIDLQKRDAEIKILLGCTPGEMETILDAHNRGAQAATLIPRQPK